MASLHSQIRGWTRAQAAVQRSGELSSSSDLLLAATLLTRQPLNYDAYCLVRDQLPAKLSRLLTATLFARLPRGCDDVVAPLVLLQYLRESMVLRHVYRCLAMYDSVGDGCLREHDLENYIFEAIADAPELAALQDNFYPFYVFTAVRNLFFFLDPNRLGRIRLRELVGSKAFSEWLRVLPPGHPFLGPAGVTLALPERPAGALGKAAEDASSSKGGSAASKGGSGGEDSSASSSSSRGATASASATASAAATAAGSSPSGAAAAGGVPASAAAGSSGSPGGKGRVAAASLVGTAATTSLLAALQWQPPAATNWFSASSALRVYNAYLELDTDQNGMLSPAELGAYQGRLYTCAFVERLFQECHTYSSGTRDAHTGEVLAEIDYKTYLDVVLASENRATLPSQRFFFKLLDVRKRGAFGLQEIHFFYSAVQGRLAAMGHDTVDAANVADEVFDMVGPASPGLITFEDVRRCKMGGVVCSMLLDAQAFVAYDRREEFGLGNSAGEEREE